MTRTPHHQVLRTMRTTLVTPKWPDLLATSENSDMLMISRPRLTEKIAQFALENKASKLKRENIFRTLDYLKVKEPREFRF